MKLERRKLRHAARTFADFSYTAGLLLVNPNDDDNCNGRICSYTRELTHTSTFILFSLSFVVPSSNKPPSKLAQQNFEKWRPVLEHSTNFNVSDAGGWSFVESLAGNPKQELVEYIMSFSDGSTETKNDKTLNALVGLLEAQGKGFDSALVDGEWVGVLSQQGKKSPKIQKLVQKREKRNLAYANFHVDQRKFYGNVTLLKYGSLQSTVAVRTTLLLFSCESSSNASTFILILHSTAFFFSLSQFPIILIESMTRLCFDEFPATLSVPHGNGGNCLAFHCPCEPRVDT